MAFTTQSITSGDTNTVITFTGCSSAVITNSHTTDDILVDLWISGTGSTFTDRTCDYNNDPTITHDNDDGKIVAGMPVSGTGIPDGATVASVTSNTEFELSASTTGGVVTNGTLTFIKDINRASVGAVYINLASGIAGYATGETGAMVIDNGSGSASPASTAAFLNERIYKTDGTFIGRCTAITTTALTVGGGIETMLANNDEIYTGNRYYLLNNVVIPNGASLRLDGNEVNFNTNNFSLLATASVAGIDIIFR